MRFLVHDFAGHPFQIQLSRKLAEYGHVVTHVYPNGLEGPKGDLMAKKSDAASLSIHAVQLSSHFKKYSPHRRFLTQRRYAGDLKKLIQKIRPHAVLSGNTPIDIQGELLWYCQRNHIGFVHWVQDIYCEAISYYFRRKLRLRWGHHILSSPFWALESAVARRSDRTVVIAPAFKTMLSTWGVAPDRISLIENWAPLEEVPAMPRDTEWRRNLGLGGAPVFLYSGTLGLKHRPDLLYSLAKELGRTCKVIVLSEGIGRNYLDAQPRLENLITMDFQPYSKLPEILASADVLVGTLEAEAGQFAVPSKILTYLCAGRPILLAGPKCNLAASVLERSQAGVVVDPSDQASWIREARELLNKESYRNRLACNARVYAESTFDIVEVANKFESILLTAALRHSPEMLRSDRNVIAHSSDSSASGSA